MSFQAIISRGLALAFVAAKDLAEDVEIVVNTSADFDFATPATQPPSNTSVFAKLVDLGDVRKSDGAVKSSKDVLLHAADIPNVGASDTIKWNSQVWVIRHITKSSRRVISARIERSS